jgi:hypothetical protein
MMKLFIAFVSERIFSPKLMNCSHSSLDEEHLSCTGSMVRSRHNARVLTKRILMGPRAEPPHTISEI